MSLQREQYADYLITNSCGSGFEISPSQCEQLLDYLDLLIKWNKAYNLSAIRDPREMLDKHLLDSLSVAPVFAEDQAKQIIDVGTGAGLPGIPMAICFPEKQFTLLDSAGKKMRFLRQVVHEMGLQNVTVVNTRVELFQPDVLFDVVISRAFASVQDMTSWCKHLLTESGEFWAMKGVFPQDELSQLEKSYKVESCSKLQVPSTVGERCLLKIKFENT